MEDAEHQTGVLSLPPANLHILIAASHPRADLCKVMLSAAALGYPSPTLINWSETFDQEGVAGGGSHVAKLTAYYDWMVASTQHMTMIWSSCSMAAMFGSNSGRNY